VGCHEMKAIAMNYEFLLWSIYCIYKGFDWSHLSCLNCGKYLYTYQGFEFILLTPHAEGLIELCGV